MTNLCQIGASLNVMSNCLQHVLNDPYYAGLASIKCRIRSDHENTHIFGSGSVFQDFCDKNIVYLNTKVYKKNAKKQLLLVSEQIRCLMRGEAPVEP